MKWLTATLITISVSTGQAAELISDFKSPAFSGVGYSSHVLTIKQLEDQQKEKNRLAAETLKAKVETAALNTPSARFQAQLESRIYSQLAKQITDSLFGLDGTPTCGVRTTGTGICGEAMLAGNTITWRLTDTTKKSEDDPTKYEPANYIYVSIVGPSGTMHMYVPSGAFGF